MAVFVIGMEFSDVFLCNFVGIMNHLSNYE